MTRDTLSNLFDERAKEMISIVDLAELKPGMVLAESVYYKIGFYLPAGRL
jgi:hypothetical protein